MLVKDLFIAMMEIVGAITLDETPDDADMQKCRRHVNMMLGSWSGRRLLLQALVQESFPLVAGKQDYTIGVGGDFNTAKPIHISSAFIQDAEVTYPVAVLDQEIFDTMSDKLIATERPTGIYYDAGVTQQSVQTGNIRCYGIPDAAYTLFINSQKYFSEFTNLTDDVTFPPSHFKALAYNGAMAIWRPMGRRGLIPPDIKQEADDSLKIIENVNHRLCLAGMDMPGTSRETSNILSGDWI